MLLYNKVLFSAIFVWSLLDEGYQAKYRSDTLYLVHILFRHGERTPRQPYPKDIYKNKTYAPFGFGELTNKGKSRMYDIGLALRNRYGQFIGNVYNHSKIDARSSNFARTRMSCELVMAAMFQPTLVETWNPKLNWQPTLCDYVSEEEDYIFLSETKCDLLSLKRVEIEKDRILGKFKQYEDLFRYLSDKSGMKIQTPAGVTPLYDTLRCQNDMNLSLPSWARSVFPSPMSNLSVLDWDYFAKTDQQKRFAGGVLLETIVNNTNKKINRRPGYTAKQIYIYSGHDSNMVPIMSILNIYPRKIMPYGITIMLEIHRINKKFIVKVYLQDSNLWSPRYMPLPKCAKNCTLQKFIKTYKKYFGTKEMCSHT